MASSVLKYLLLMTNTTQLLSTSDTPYTPEPGEQCLFLHPLKVIEAVQRSILLALERNESHNHTLSLNSLPPAQYLVLVYEVNREGSLSSGVSYPAVVCELNASHFKKGTPQFLRLVF